MFIKYVSHKYLKNTFEGKDIEEKEVSSILENTTKHGAIK